MVDEPNLTTDGRLSLTTAELDMLEGLLKAHDRKPTRYAHRLAFLLFIIADRIGLKPGFQQA